jgi:hypothetical protein
LKLNDLNKLSKYWANQGLFGSCTFCGLSVKLPPDSDAVICNNCGAVVKAIKIIIEKIQDKDLSFN